MGRRFIIQEVDEPEEESFIAELMKFCIGSVVMLAIVGFIMQSCSEDADKKDESAPSQTETKATQPN